MLITWMISALALESDSMRSRGSLLRGRTAFSIYRFDNRDRAFVIALFSGITLTAIGGDPWGDDDVLQSQNHLEAIGKRKRSDRRRLRRAVSAAHGAGMLDGIPVP